MKESRAAKAARLEEESRAALSAGNFKRAVAIGIRLKESSYAGYELHARGLWEMGYREDAFRVLQAGVKMAPTAPTLWALQGEWMGQLTEAAKTHIERQVVSGQAGPVLFGAVIALRRAQFEEALSAVEQLTERELPAGSLAAVRAYALHGLGRHEESRDVAAAGLSEDVDEETKSRLLHVRGLAHLSLGEPALALKYALGSYEADRSNPDPLGLIRRARDAKSPASQFLDILCRGTEDGGEFAAHFIRFSVVAEGVEEALSFILEIEGGSAGSSLAVDEVLSRRPAPDQLKGVYRVSRRVPFKPG